MSSGIASFRPIRALWRATILTPALPGPRPQCRPRPDTRHPNQPEILDPVRDDPPYLVSADGDPPAGWERPRQYGPPHPAARQRMRRGFPLVPACEGYCCDLASRVGGATVPGPLPCQSGRGEPWSTPGPCGMARLCGSTIHLRVAQPAPVHRGAGNYGGHGAPATCLLPDMPNAEKFCAKSEDIVTIYTVIALHTVADKLGRRRSRT